MKLKERLKRKYYILITFLISLFLFIIIFSLYSKKLNPKLNDYIDFLVKDEIYKKVIKSNNFITNEEVNDILYIDKNKSNEIVYLDYDIDKTYKLLNKYIDSLKKDNSKSKILTVPFFIASDNIIISSLGPKIKFKYEIIDNVKGKIKTKVTDFGVNNALVEMYFELEIGYLVVIPMNKKESVLKTEILISSKIINGKVPTFYGKNIFKESGVSTSN
ncbi:sporulation protein YunB [Mycoplasma sp. CAG:472]|nr:sporulation protein YunB [Mycoplasma sp. CAG:472]